MILSERVLGSSGTTRIVLGLAIGPISLPVVAEVLDDCVAGVHGVATKDHEHDDGLPGDFVGGAHDGGFGHRGMAHQRRFDLGWWRGPAPPNARMRRSRMPWQSSADRCSSHDFDKCPWTQICDTNGGACRQVIAI